MAASRQWVTELDVDPTVAATPAASVAPPSVEQLQLLERVPAIVYIAAPGEHGRFHYASPQLEAILGFSVAEWCADPSRWAAQLHPEDRERVLERERHHRTDRAGVEEYRVLHRNGRVVWLRDEAQLLPGPDGDLLWHGVLSDITAHKRFEAELRRRAGQQSAVATLGEHALEGAGTAELEREAVTAAAQSLGAEIGGLMSFDPGHGTFVLRAQYGADEDDLGRTLVAARPDTLPGAAMLTGIPSVVEDWSTETRFAYPPLLAALDVVSSVTVHIAGAHGTFGVLGVHSRRARRYRPDELDFLQSLANVLADALERQAVEDDIRHRAVHDDLTGLPNRALFLDRIEQALARLRRRETIAAVLFLDLDHFKVINDSLGHHVGDELLAAAAPRLRDAVRASDTVARLGGDEFAILLEDLHGEADAVEMARRLAAVFARPFSVGGSEHFVAASIGIALARGGELPMELIRDADAAMYRAKERGRARYEVFDEAMRGRALARLQVENDLRRALERGELRLDYQPIVSLADRRLVGVEALVRWHHPQRGLVAPADFIPVAEENGLIGPIGEWVLERACRQAAHWHTLTPYGPPLEMSVNLSAMQLSDPGILDTVAAALEASGLDPRSLCLEITETATVDEPDAVARTLRALVGLGVRPVLDDFGTGYSSLSHLPRLPLDALKIDRSFIDGLGVEAEDTAITEAIIAMARALSLRVVAEGVEEETQAQALTELGCELAQGFLFSRPVAAGAITAMLGARSPAARDGRGLSRVATA